MNGKTDSGLSLDPLSVYNTIAQMVLTCKPHFANIKSNKVNGQIHHCKGFMEHTKCVPARVPLQLRNI